MSYRPLPDVAQSADELRQLLRQERDPTPKARLHLLLLIQDGQVTSQAEAAEHLARHLGHHQRLAPTLSRRRP